MAFMVIVAAVSAAIEVGSFVYRLTHQPKLRPPVADLQISSAIDGAPISFGWSRVRIAGNLLWTPGLFSIKAGVPGGGGGSNFGGGATQFLFFANCAYEFCEGPATFTRLWGDSKLIYDSTPGTSEFPPADFPAWTATALYNIGDIVSYNGQTYTSEQQSMNIFPGQTADETGGILYWQVLGSYAPWDINQTYNPGDVVISGGVLYVNIQTTTPPAHTVGNDHYWQLLTGYYGNFTFYPGTQTQNPDPMIQANEGVANTPAFRGLAYVAIEQFRLANFGNRLPNLRAELVIGPLVEGGTPVLRVADVVFDVCKRAGLQDSEIDVSFLTSATLQPNDIVQGYAVTRTTAAAEIIKTLFQAYFFDACESDGTLRFIPRGLSSVVTIPEIDLGLLQDGAKVKPEQISQAQDLPQSVTVMYNDVAMDFQQGKQLKQRSSRIIKTRQQQIIELPLTLDASLARQIAEKTLWIAWLERTSYSTNLWRALYMVLDPTDVLSFVYEGLTFQIRVLDSVLGQGFTVTINGAGDNQGAYLSSAIGGSAAGFIPRPLLTNSPTLLFIFDVPLLRDVDSSPGLTGDYAGLTSTLLDWPGGAIFRAVDDANFDSIDSSTTPLNFGYATTVLGAPRSPWTWDKVNTLTVKMSLGTLIGVSDLNVLNGANAFLLGSPANGWEAIQAKSIVLNLDGTYTLSRFLRGRRGTEGKCGSHAVGDLIVPLPTGMLHEVDSLANVNQLRYYKGVTSGQDPSGVASQQFTNTANDLRPYAPTSIKGARDGSHNLTIDWIRRTRIGGAWLDFSGTVPLSEDSEAYSIDIMNGSSVVRTILVTSPTASYSAADQTTDFGSAQASLAVRVYQLSGEIGRGFAGKATI